MVLSARYSRLREFASSVSSTSMWMSRSCRLARSKQMSMCARASASLYSYQGSPPTTSQPCLSASSSSSAAPGSRTIPSCGKATTWMPQRRAYFSRTSSNPCAARNPPIVPTSANSRKNVVPFLIPVSITRPARRATSCGSYLRLKSLVISIASGSVPETFGRMTSPSSALSACRCRLTKPGTTRSPAASIVCAADAARLGATAAIRPCSMPISTSWSRPRSRALRMRRFMAYQFASASRSAAASRDRAPPSNPLQNVQTARAVDEVDQAAVVVADVIALDARRPCGHRRHERCGLARGVRIGDVDDSQAMRKPGDGDFRAAHLFAKLVQAGVVLFRRAVLLSDLEARERNRTRFVGDVDDPEKRRGGRAKAHDVLIGNQHHAAAAQRKRHRERGDDAGAVRRRDVADICDPLAHDHLPAAITIEVADDLYTVTVPAVHALPDRGSLRQNFILRLPIRSTNRAEQARTRFVTSLDQRVGACDERWRNFEAECLRGLEVDDQFEPGRLQHRQIGGIRLFEHERRIRALLAIQIGKLRSIAHQAACRGEIAPVVERRNGIAC